MQVEKSKLVAVLMACGVDSVDSWPVEKLAERINKDGGISRYLDTGVTLSDPEHAKLYDAIVADQAAGNMVEVLPEEAPAAEVKTPPKKSGKKAPAKKPTPEKSKKPATSSAANLTKKAAAVKAKRQEEKAKKYAVSTDPKLTWKQRLAGWKKKPYQLTNKGVGIVRTLVDELINAGKGKLPKPVTREHLLSVLIAKFKDRDPLKMETTVYNQVPTQLREYRQMNVQMAYTQDGRRGYYIVPGPITPFIRPENPKAKKTEKQPTKKKAKKESKKLVGAK